MRKTATGKKAGTAGTPPKAARAPHAGWPSGLEALARAQHEGAKVFESLLKQGQRLEQKTKRAAVDTAVAARGGLSPNIRSKRKVGSLLGGGKT